MTYTDRNGIVHIVDTWDELCYWENLDIMDEWDDMDESDIQFIWDKLN